VFEVTGGISYAQVVELKRINAAKPDPSRLSPVAIDELAATGTLITRFLDRVRLPVTANDIDFTVASYVITNGGRVYAIVAYLPENPNTAPIDTEPMDRVARSLQGTVALAAPKTLVLVAENVAFSPETLDGAAGEPIVVRVEKRDQVRHVLVIQAGPYPDSAQGLKTEPLDPGSHVDHSINVLGPGTYSYTCLIHPTQMHGVLTIE
jgi:plastocyanin